MEERRKILVVDDDPDIRVSLRTVLESAGYLVIEAADGDEAWELLQGERPDLMVLDIMMSHDTEGFELANRLLSDPQLRDMPILMLTSFLEKVNEEGPETFQHILGEPWPARVLLEKPIAPEKLLSKVASLLTG